MDNDNDEKKGMGKKERSLINFTYFVACSDPQAAVDFLYRSLKKVGKEELFPFFKEKVASLLEENKCHYEAALLRSIDKM